MDENGTDVMTSYLQPGVYVEEVGDHASVIVGVSVNVVGVIGQTDHIQRQEERLGEK